MAKIVLKNSPPDPHIADAMICVRRLITTKRGRDSLAVASLSSIQQKLAAAAAELSIYNHREAVRCRATALKPELVINGASHEQSDAGGTLQPRHQVRPDASSGDGLAAGADGIQADSRAMPGGEGSHDESL
jgi:hypothetical protein